MPSHRAASSYSASSGMSSRQLVAKSSANSSIRSDIRTMSGRPLSLRPKALGLTAWAVSLNLSMAERSRPWQ
eukprot:11652970-Heterocapsa_arctica.AAC.1